MAEKTRTVARHATPAPGFVEFVVLMAAAMGLSSLSIDNVLPAFAAVGEALSVADANDLQYLVYVYMVGFALAQIVYGPLADMVGRRRAMQIGLVVYAAGSLAAVLATTFPLLLAGRLVQGIGAAAARVVTLTIVRDRYSGHEMARVMSFVMMVFLIVPVFAPAIGSLFLLLGGWRAVFASMLGMAVLLAAAYALRLPETLPPERRMAPSARRLLGAVKAIVTSRATLGYATALGLLFGALMGYIGSSQQIFATRVYGLGALFPLVFGALAGGMTVASLLSARVVRHIGMRRLSHLSLTVFLAVSAALVVLSFVYAGKPPLPVFAGLLGVLLFAFAIAVPNFNAIAMEPLGAVAGTASSLIGCYTTVLGAAVGAIVGQAFDDTVVPLCLGFLVLGGLAFAVVAWTERGALFRGPFEPRAGA